MKKNKSEIIIYQTASDEIRIQARLHDETVWLNRHQMAELFDRDIKTIGKHINNTFNEGELDKNSVVAKFATTADDGKTYKVEYYNLDVIISVGYRVKSLQGTKFRQWATKRMQEKQVIKKQLKKLKMNMKNIEKKQTASIFLTLIVR